MRKAFFHKDKFLAVVKIPESEEQQVNGLTIVPVGVDASEVTEIEVDEQTLAMLKQEKDAILINNEIKFPSQDKKKVVK